MRLYARLVRTYTAICLLLAAVACYASPVAMHVTDLQGRVVTQFAPSGAKLVVFLFAATDCPISRRYIPEIARIGSEFASQGVVLWWIFPNPGDTATVVSKHELNYSIHDATLIDTQQELVRMAHVAVTPEAAVFAVENQGLREVYHGRIDDRYLAVGKARPQATQHDLEDAIKAALSGNTAPHPSGGPVGCSIVPLSLKP